MLKTGNVFQTKSTIKYIIVEFLEAGKTVKSTEKGLFSGIVEYKDIDIFSGTFINLRTNDDVVRSISMNTISIVSIETLDVNDMRESCFFKAHEEDQLMALDILKRCITLLIEGVLKEVTDTMSIIDASAFEDVPGCFYEPFVGGNDKGDDLSKFGAHNRHLQKRNGVGVQSGVSSYGGIPTRTTTTDYSNKSDHQKDTGALHKFSANLGPSFAADTTTYNYSYKKGNTDPTLIKRKSRKPRSDVLEQLFDATLAVQSGEYKPPRKIKKVKVKTASTDNGKEDTESECATSVPAVIEEHNPYSAFDILVHPIKHYGELIAKPF